MRALVVSFALIFGACAGVEDPAAKGGDHGELPASDDDLQPAGPDGGVGTGTNDQNKPLVYSGKYELTSMVDLAGAGIFGETISTTLVQLSLFHEHPAATILNLMALYDVPYFSQVWGVLPGFLKDPVTNLLDDLIVDAVFGNVPAIDKAAQIVDDIASVSRNVELITLMSLRGPTAAGQLRGDHTMTGLGFKLWTWHATIPIPADFGQITQLEVRAGFMAQHFPDGEGATLTIAKQNFAIPYGRMLMDALKTAVFMPAGATDLGGYLNKVFNCTSIGSALGNICVFGGCVSDLVDTSDIQGFCRSGFTTLGFVVETAVRSLKFDLVDLTNGTCKMYDKGYADTKGDGKMDAIVDGTWDMAIKVSGKTKTVKSDFDGKRVGDFN